MPVYEVGFEVVTIEFMRISLEADSVDDAEERVRLHDERELLEKAHLDTKERRGIRSIGVTEELDDDYPTDI